MTRYDISKIENVFASNDASTNKYIVIDTEKCENTSFGKIMTSKALVDVVFIGFGENAALEEFKAQYPAPRYEINMGDIEGNNVIINSQF